MTEDEMVGWHHRIDGCEFEQAPGVGDGQGSLACCSPWGRKESDTVVTELNWFLHVTPEEVGSSDGYVFTLPRTDLQTLQLNDATLNAVTLN